MGDYLCYIQGMEVQIFLGVLDYYNILPYYRYMITTSLLRLESESLLSETAEVCLGVERF